MDAGSRVLEIGRSSLYAFNRMKPLPATFSPTASAVFLWLCSRGFNDRLPIALLLFHLSHGMQASQHVIGMVSRRSGAQCHRNAVHI